MLFFFSTALVYHRSCAGRGGELWFATWDRCSWDCEKHVMHAGCYQSKTNKISALPHSRDKHDWSLDVIVMLGCMLIADAETHDHEDANKPFIFTSIHDNKPLYASTMLNKIIKNVEDEVNGLNKKSRSHDIRYGALADMQANVDLQMIYAIFRGDWAFLGDCTGLNYADRDPGVVEAGKAVGGWKCTKEIIMSCDAMDLMDLLLGADADELVKTNFTNLVAALFKGMPLSREKSDICYNLRNIFFCAVVEKAPEIFADLKELRGRDSGMDVLEKNLRFELVSHDFTMTDLFDWSNKVRGKMCVC